MDKFLIYSGGMPLYLDDIAYLDNIYRNTFKELLQAFNLPQNISCILKGCNVIDNGNHYSVSEGIVVLNGEILYAPAHNVTKSPSIGVYQWFIKTEYYPDGYKTLQNGQNKPCWEKRIAYAAKALTPTVTLPLFGAKTLLDYVNDYIAQKLSTKVEQTQLVQPNEFFSGWGNETQGNNPVRYYKDLTQRVYLSGYAIKLNPNAGNNIFTLPNEYRPQFMHDFITLGLNSQQILVPIKCIINPEGVVTALNNLSNSYPISSVYLNNISFRYNN